LPRWRHGRAPLLVLAAIAALAEELFQLRPYVAGSAAVLWLIAFPVIAGLVVRSWQTCYYVAAGPLVIFLTGAVLANNSYERGYLAIGAIFLTFLSGAATAAGVGIGRAVENVRRPSAVSESPTASPIGAEFGLTTGGEKPGRALETAERKVEPSALERTYLHRWRLPLILATLPALYLGFSTGAEDMLGPALVLMTWLFAVTVIGGLTTSSSRWIVAAPLVTACSVSLMAVLRMVLRSDEPENDPEQGLAIIGLSAALAPAYGLAAALALAVSKRSLRT
jgi:hypothetical protein